MCSYSMPLVAYFNIFADILSMVADTSSLFQYVIVVEWDDGTLVLRSRDMYV